MSNLPTNSCYISANLRFVRKIMGLNQAQTAQLMCISRTSYNSLEHGTRDATFKDLHTLEQISGICMDNWLNSNMQTKFIASFRSDALLLTIGDFLREYAKLSSKGRRVIADHISYYYRQEVEL
ncbi:MAG: helix-turn-helix transcriptional regulator [Bacillota bacterium]|nr:helix-turn-helix transcriptional regulator [Bacillota bacterium]